MLAASRPQARPPRAALDWICAGLGALMILLHSFIIGIGDGPTEVHKLTVAKAVLSQHKPSPGLWPSEFLPERVAAARARYAEYLEHEVQNL